MKHLFYFWAILAIMWELYSLKNPIKTLNFFLNMKGKKYEDYDIDQKGVSFLYFLYVMWVFVGIFSNQWFSFLWIIFLGIIVPRKIIPLRVLDAALTVLILMFIILNEYHFHINAADEFQKILYGH